MKSSTVVALLCWMPAACGGSAGDRPAGGDRPAVARHADAVDLVVPPGVELYGGADIESRVDRTGAVFVAATGKTPRGFGAVLWVQRPQPDGTWEAEPIDLGGLYPAGRGSLSVEADGLLYLTVWDREGADKRMRARRLRIPKWTP